MERARRAELDSLSIDGLDEVFSEKTMPGGSEVALSKTNQKVRLQSAQARATSAACALARFVDAGSDAVIEHHKVKKAKGKKGKVTEEWRIKWNSAAAGDKKSAIAKANTEHELFETMSELIRQNTLLMQRLEAASYRIGYLESELEAARRRIEITDCDAQVEDFSPPREIESVPVVRAITSNTVAAPAGGFFNWMPPPL